MELGEDRRAAFGGTPPISLLYFSPPFLFPLFLSILDVKLSKLSPEFVTGIRSSKLSPEFVLLCPFEALRNFLGSDSPEDEDIAAAAGYFHVDPRVVRSLLINKNVIERASLSRLDASLDQASFLEMLDAA